MTATTLPPLTGQAAPAAPSVLRLTRVELRKAVDTRSGRWLLAVIALLGAAATTVILFVGDPVDQSFESLFLVAQIPVALLLPVVGILAVTTEWSQRTALTTFTLTPRRGLVVVAKVAAAVVLGLLVFAATLLAAAVATGIASLRADGVSWSFPTALVASFALVQVVNVLVGVAFGLLLLNTPLAIVTFYVLPQVVTVVTNLVAALGGAAPWIDLNVGMAPLMEPGTVTGEQWAQFGSVLLIWLVVPLVAGAFRLSRKEIS